MSRIWIIKQFSVLFEIRGIKWYMYLDAKCKIWSWFLTIVSHGVKFTTYAGKLSCLCHFQAPYPSEARFQFYNFFTQNLFISFSGPKYRFISPPIINKNFKKFRLALSQVFKRQIVNIWHEQEKIEKLWK